MHWKSLIKLAFNVSLFVNCFHLQESSIKIHGILCMGEGGRSSNFCTIIIHNMCVVTIHIVVDMVNFYILVYIFIMANFPLIYQPPALETTMR